MSLVNGVGPVCLAEVYEERDPGRSTRGITHLTDLQNDRNSPMLATTPRTSFGSFRVRERSPEYKFRLFLNRAMTRSVCFTSLFFCLIREIRSTHDRFLSATQDCQWRRFGWHD